MQSPGIVNFPVFFTSVVASVTRLSMTSPTAFFFMAFIAFIAFIAFTIVEKSSEEVLK